MEAIHHAVASLKQAEPRVLTIALVGFVLLALTVSMLWPKPGPRRPPMLGDTIPYVTNTFQYMANMDKFLARGMKALNKTNIIGFHLGPRNAFFVKGAQNVSTMFRNTPAINTENFILLAMSTMMNLSPRDLAKFARDKSGRSAKPLPGHEGMPPSERMWFRYTDLMHRYLSQTRYATAVAASYQRFFGEELERRFPRVGEWKEARVLCDIMKADMLTAATVSLLGKRILEVAPDLFERFWEAHKIFGLLLYKPPKWAFPSAYATMERFVEAGGRFFPDAWERFDWSGPDVEADWEPVFGSRFYRELARWMKQVDFTQRSISGMTSATAMVSLNANTIPIAAWSVIEVARDPELQRALREEVETALTTDGEGRRVVDQQKMVALPLLQSLYFEIMRVHVSINVSREVAQPLEVEGYRLLPGDMLQAPTLISHFDEAVWGVEGHPASEFWAARHVRYVDEKDDDGKVRRVPKFEPAGRPTDWFPYGGGISICPGRHFAKQEIMLTVAVLVSRFEIEFARYVNKDGSVSDRPPMDDLRYSGAILPDRDMMVRWKRLW